MAKITIDDRVSEGTKDKRTIIPANIRNAIHQGLLAAQARLDDADDLIEVIKITPVDIQPGSECTVNIKLVISIRFVHEDMQTLRCQRNFDMHCFLPDFDGETISNLVECKTVDLFGQIVGYLISGLDHQSSKLRDTLLELGAREELTGQNKRCYHCCAPLIEEGGILRCKRCNPSSSESVEHFESDAAEANPTVPLKLSYDPKRHQKP